MLAEYRVESGESSTKSQKQVSPWRSGSIVSDITVPGSSSQRVASKPELTPQ